MLISIIIPTYNSKDYLQKALKSIYSQKYNNLEIIVIDNGSSDGTGELLKDKYPEVSVIRNKENLGAAAARNQGIGISKGEYAMFMDCDVELGNGFFGELEKILKNLCLRTALTKL